jgi:hypothetical protein
MSTTLNKIVSNDGKREVTKIDLEMSLSLDAKYAKVVRNSIPYKYGDRADSGVDAAAAQRAPHWAGKQSTSAPRATEPGYPSRCVLLVKDAHRDTQDPREDLDCEWYHSIDLAGVTTPGM